MREQVGLKAPWVYCAVKKLNPSPGSVPVEVEAALLFKFQPDLQRSSFAYEQKSGLCLKWREINAGREDD